MGRPGWSCCFAELWLLVAAGAALLHLAIHRAVPPLVALPDNIALGFGKIFKFDYLQQDSAVVRESSVKALEKCGVVAPVMCPHYQPAWVPGRSDTGEEREATVNAFHNSLAIIWRVADDQYFGTPELRKAAWYLRFVSTNLEQLEDVMDCWKSNVIWCKLYDAAGELLGKVEEIKAEIRKPQESELMEFFNENSGYFKYFQGLPYLLVLAMLFYTCAWCQGGTCCREGSSAFGCVFLVLFAVLWTSFFAVTAALIAVAVGLRVSGGKIEVPLNGEPSLEELLEHIQDTYPAFWDTAFAHLVTSLTLMVRAAAILLAVCVLVLTYAYCICVCVPYRKRELFY